MISKHDGSWLDIEREVGELRAALTATTDALGGVLPLARASVTHPDDCLRFMEATGGCLCNFDEREKPILVAASLLAKLAEPAPPKPSTECTGVAATWCPVHGDCTCEKGTEQNGFNIVEERDDCPLHGVGSTHADPRFA